MNICLVYKIPRKINKNYNGNTAKYKAKFFSFFKPYLRLYLAQIVFRSLYFLFRQLIVSSCENAALKTSR